MHDFFYKLSGKPKYGSISNCAKREWIIFIILFVIEINSGFKPSHGMFAKIVFGMVLSIFAWQFGWIMSMNRFYLLNKEDLVNKEIRESCGMIGPFSLKMLIGLAFSICGFLISLKILKIVLLLISILICWSAGWGMNITTRNQK